MSIIKKLYKGLGNVTFQGIAVGGMELARGIEPPTCGLQNSHQGLLKSLKTWAIPASIEDWAS